MVSLEDIYQHPNNQRSGKNNDKSMLRTREDDSTEVIWESSSGDIFAQAIIAG